MLQEIIQQEKGSALYVVMLLSVLLSLTLLIFIGSFVQQHRYTRGGLKAVQAHYHAESGIIEWLAALNRGSQPFPTESHEATYTLLCRDSVTIRSRRWGVFQRIYSQEFGQTEGIQATVGYANTDEFSAGLIVEPVPQPLIVCENTRLYGEVICGLQGVQAQHLQGIPYSGEKTVYGRVIKSNQDLRPKVQTTKTQELRQYYQSIIDEWQRRYITELPLNPKNKIQLTKDGIYETIKRFNTDSILTILGPGKLLVNDASFFEQKLNIQNEVEILISEQCRIGAEVRLRDVIIFSTFPLILQGLEAKQLQVISTSEISIIGNTRLTESSVLLSIAENEGTGISISGQSAVNGSICLINGSERPAEWANSIQINHGVKITGLVYSDWLLNLSGEVTGSCVTSQFY
ncbi:MAG: hypothetical protein AAFP70_09535, partial [Calditrichota bacterium]